MQRLPSSRYRETCFTKQREEHVSKVVPKAHFAMYLQKHCIAILSERLIFSSPKTEERRATLAFRLFQCRGKTLKQMFTAKKAKRDDVFLQEFVELPPRNQASSNYAKFASKIKCCVTTCTTRCIWRIGLFLHVRASRRQLWLLYIAEVPAVREKHYGSLCSFLLYSRWALQYGNVISIGGNKTTCNFNHIHNTSITIVQPKTESK